MSKTQNKKSAPREWLDAIVFAVVVATLVRWLIVEPYTIPTQSMEGSLLVGDYLFVSKFHYGARNAKTLMQIPLSHQKIWGTEIPSYLNWIQVPFFRLPGFSEIRRNDAVVFNYPPELDKPVDMRTHYVKRCVAEAGDTLVIENNQVFINGAPLPYKGKKQANYYVQTESPVRDRIFEDFNIRDHFGYAGNNVYLIHTDTANMKAFASLPFVKRYKKIEHSDPRQNRSIFPESNKFNWTVDNFGPLYIPKQGDIIELNERNLSLYGYLIQHYEGNENVSIVDNQLFIEDTLLTKYSFEQNYYFMIGDNRHNSEDSRYWGFVPEDHVVGKGLFTWFSLNDGPWYKFFNRIRWDRIIRKIE